MSGNRLTPEQYAGKAKALIVELDRCRQILDSAAIAEDKYGIKPNQALLTKVRADWHDVVRRLNELDDAFWGVA
jgi:hypothetical protein